MRYRQRSPKPRGRSGYYWHDYSYLDYPYWNDYHRRPYYWDYNWDWDWDDYYYWNHWR